jgi:hypothetical protein
VTRHHSVSYRQIVCETLPVIPTLSILRLSAASFDLSRNVVPTAADRLVCCGHRSLHELPLSIASSGVYFCGADFCGDCGFAFRKRSTGSTSGMLEVRAS